jgi:3-deoxy-D-manno-octulosonic acid (KDO) 8-phosphate synthase
VGIQAKEKRHSCARGVAEQLDEIGKITVAVTVAAIIIMQKIDPERAASAWKLKLPKVLPFQCLIHL